MKLKHVLRAPADEAGEDLSAGRGDTIDELLKDDQAVIDVPAKVSEIEDDLRVAGVKDKSKSREDYDKHETTLPRDSEGKFIPKGVFDDRIAKERLGRETAERRAAELEAKMGQVSRSEDVAKLEASVTEMEKTHAKLLLDGNHEKAAEVMRDIRMTERKIVLQESRDGNAQIASETRESIKMDLAIERLETTYPGLNPSDADYNQELVEEVLGWQSVYMERHRLSPSQALAKAADKVMSLQTTQTSAASPSPAKGLSAGQPDVPGRKQDQVAKNIAAAAAQPANTKGVGKDSDKAGMSGKIDVASMSMADYDALPETMRAQLRGDFVS